MKAKLTIVQYFFPQMFKMKGNPITKQDANPAGFSNAPTITIESFITNNQKRNSNSGNK